MNLTIKLFRNDCCWSGFVEEIGNTDCTGDTLKQCIDNVYEAYTSYMDNICNVITARINQIAKDVNDGRTIS